MSPVTTRATRRSICASPAPIPSLPASVPPPVLPAARLWSSSPAGVGAAVDPVIQGYEIVNIDNDTLEVGFHVGFVMKGGVI